MCTWQVYEERRLLPDFRLDFLVDSVDLLSFVLGDFFRFLGDFDRCSDGDLDDFFSVEGGISFSSFGEAGCRNGLIISSLCHTDALSNVLLIKGTTSIIVLTRTSSRYCDSPR